MGVDVDMDFLIPNGILKIIEVVINIIIMGITARAALHRFALAAAIIFFLFTLVIFFCVLFKAYAQPNGGGKKTWIIVDLVHNCIAVLFFLIALILLAIDVDTIASIVRGSELESLGIAACIFCFLNMVAYIISLVISVFDFQGKKFPK